MEKIFDEKYDILNPEQKRAVDTIDGPVFVMAGPGTGKTQILTLRIANILRIAPDIEPENILALTFTNTAAYNMRERLSQIVGGELAYRVTISTFHAFAEEVMKKFPEYFPQFEGARLLSPVEQIETLENIVDGMTDLVHFSKFKRRESTLKNIAFSIGKIKGEGLSVESFIDQVNEKYETDREDPEMFYKRKYGEFNKGDLNPRKVLKLEKKKEKSLELVEIYKNYQTHISQKSLYDFADLMLSFVTELESDSEFQTEIQEQYHYMLVDEHQDTNDAQNRILHALIDNPVWEGKPNIFAVGDAKQAIFRFAGASENSYSSLLSKLTNVETISLEHNYRSHQTILDRSHSLISKSPYHSDETELKAFFDHGGIFQYREFQNYKMEALYVAQDIKKRIDEGTDPNEIAVLYRTNKDGEDIRNLLSIYGIPVQDFSKKNILKDPDIMKLFLILRSMYDLTDNESLAKSLFIDFLGFDVYDVQRVINTAKLAKSKENKTIYSIISDPKRLSDSGISSDQQKLFIQYADMLSRGKSESENSDFVTFFSWFIRESGFLKYIMAQNNAQIGITKIEKLFDEIRKESTARENFEFSDFTHYLNTLKKHNISMNIMNSLSEGVQLMTFHGSKGLEFDIVYIIQALHRSKRANDISLPFEDFSDGETDDERRLMYVAMTRAKQECHISSHIINAEGKEKNVSPFIADTLGIENVDMVKWEQEHTADIVDFFGFGDTHVQSLLDHENIKKLFMSKQLSVSALNNYMESTLKYFFRNLVSLPEARSHFLDFGNLMHETLEDYFNQCKTENTILGAETLRISFEKVLNSRYYYDEFKDRAWLMLESYHAHNHEKFVLPVENELTIRGIPFDIGNDMTIHLSGAIDKITRNDDGSLTVWDYKTGRTYSDMDKKRREKTKRQAIFYKLLLQHAYDGRYNFRTTIFDFLEKNDAGEYEQQEFEITQDDVDILKNEIMELVHDIMNGTLLEKDFRKDSTNAELLEFLEVMRGPRTYEQPSLLDK